MRILVIMDPPERVNRYTDTTLAIVEEALRRKHDVAVTTPNQLWLEDGDVGAAYHHALLPLDGAPEVPGLRVGKASAALLEKRFDLVLLRKDPPFDIDYHYTTLLLERLRDRVPVLNDPRGLRLANEKLYMLQFPSLVPPTLVTRSQAALIDFMRRQGGEMMVKPLDGSGGQGVFHVRADDRNHRALLEMVIGPTHRLVMAQRYLPASREGDKRILLLDGEVLGAVLRVPRADDNRSNFHAGGIPARTTLDERDQEIIAAVAPALRRDGLYLVGLDVIGGQLTEVNVTSPAGVQEIDRLEGTHLEARIVDWLERFPRPAPTP